MHLPLLSTHSSLPTLSPQRSALCASRLALSPLLSTLSCLLLLSLAQAEETWPQFRGPQSSGTSTNTQLPDTWSPTQNVEWKTDLPGRSWSSPITWNNQVFLTTVINSGESEPPKKGLYFGGNRPEPPPTSHAYKTLSLDLHTGKLLWETTLHDGQPQTAIHLKSSYGAETPVTDGTRVYSLFGGLGVYALTLDGQLLWSHPLPPRPVRYGWGYASSPILHNNQLLILNDNDEQSELLALNPQTGKELWRTPRDEKSNWASPHIWQNQQRTELITCGTQAVRSYNLKGELLWSLQGMSSIVIPTPVSTPNLLFVSSGYVGDKTRPVYAIQPGASGDISLQPDTTSNAHIAWSHPTAGPYNPSPVLYDNRLYILLDRGLVSCFNATTGEQLYDRERLPNGYAFTASPWAHNGKIFCLNEDGRCFVLQAGDTFNILHVNELSDDDMCMATPALPGNRLLIRTSTRLYSIRNPQ